MINQSEEEINLCEELIKQQEAVPECSLMKEGYHSQKRKYYFCVCDPDCQEPLCISCLEKCHSLHWGSKSLGEFQTDSRNALCHCGQRNHFLLEDNTRSEFIYSEQCLFMEWSRTSRSYIYYEKTPNDNLCMFCYKCCSKNPDQYTKKVDEGKFKDRSCSCKHPDYLNVFGKIDHLIKERPFAFESFTEIQFLNMIIMSEKSFENSFHRMRKSLDELKNGLNSTKTKKKDFDFTVFTNNSPFMKALEKIDNILGISKSLFYSKDIINCYPYIYNCIERTFLYTNQDNIWLLKKSLFNIFHKLNFRKDFESLPRFNVKDISNLNPFQRIMYSEYIKNVPELLKRYLSHDINTKKNYVDQLLTILEKYKNIKSKNSNAYEILRKIYSQCKKLVRFNSFTIEQSMKFYSLNDEIIYNSINNKDIRMSTGLEQMKMLSQIVKCILYMAYYYNDSIIKMYLNNEVLLNHVSFFHSNNEIAKMIYKNCVHILLYCRTVQQICCSKDSSSLKISIDVKQSSRNSESSGYENYSSNNILVMKKIEKFHNKIMFIATDITALTLNYPDSYLFGLRRLIKSNQEISYGYLKNIFTLKESSILSEINYMYNNLERMYQQFFEFEISANVLEQRVIEIIQRFFVVIGQKNFNSRYSTHEKRKNESAKLKSRKNNIYLQNMPSPKQQEEIDNEKYRILLNKSPLVFSLIKSLKIILTIKSYEKNSISQDYIEKIFNFLLYYVENNSDNCLVILTNDILKTLIMLTDDIIHFIELLEYAITVIMKNKISLSQNNVLMKVCEELVQRVSGECVNIISFYTLLRLIEKLSKMNYLHQEHTINKIRKTMKNIYTENPLLKTFKGILISSVETNNWLSQQLQNDSKIKNKYDLKKVLKLFTKFLKILNYLFDGNSTFNEIDFLKSIFDKKQIQVILSDITLDIPLRIELLKLYRIGYIDSIIETTKLNEYVHILSNDVKNDIDSNAANFNFFQDLLKVKDKKLDMKVDSKVLNFELQNFRKTIESNQSLNRKKILNYFEEGIILPLHVFINKYISIIYNLNGKQYIKLYEIVLHFLELKQYCIDDNNIIEQQMKDETNLLKNIGLEKNNKLSLIIRKISAEEKMTLQNDINDLKNKNIEILNYKKLFKYFLYHVNGFVSSPQSKYLKDVFSKKNKTYTEEDIFNLRTLYEKEGLLKTEFSEKTFQIIIKYENDKTKLVNSSLSQNLAEKNVLYDATYRSIMLRPMFYLINSETLYLKYRRQNLWQIFRLLQYDTNGSQDDILALRKSEKDLEKLAKNENRISFEEDSSIFKETPKLTVDLNYLIDLFIQNLLSIIFGSCNPSVTSQNEDYTIAYMVIKIMKYMCEDHNTKFQTIFFKEIKIDAKNNISLNMFELMMCSLCKIVLLSKWTQQNVNTNDNVNSNSYFYEIFFCMIEFAIEMVQGTTKNNLLRIIQTKHRKEEKSFFFKFLKSVKDIVINNSNNSEIVYNVRLDVLNFITAFVEEKSTPEKIIVLLSNLYNPVAIFDSIVIILKKLYLKITHQTDKGLLSKIEINHDICQLFIDEYFSVSEFSKYQEFELANRMYNYVKQLTSYGIKEAKNIIDSINLYTEKELIELRTKQFKNGKEIFNKDNAMIDPKYCQNYYAVKFFESITRTVYIQGEEKQIQMVLFTLNPTVLFLSENTKNDFCQNTPRDSRSSKLFALMEYTSYFFIEINHNKKRFAGNIFLKILNKINYRIVEALMFILTVAINIVIFVSINNDDENSNYMRVYGWIFYPNIVQVALNAIFLLFWIVSKFSLYFVIEKEKYYIRNRKNKDIPLGFFEHVQIIIFHTLLTKKEIISFAWNLIFSITSLCSSKNLFVFSIQLFLAINLSKTLRNLALAITMRYQQILTSLMFLFVAVYVFSTLAFFLLSKDFIVTVENNQENGCGSLLYCFFTHMEFGLRTDGGIGEYIHKLSFGDNPGYFMGMFFYQFVFFVVIIIIMLAVIGGSVIDTFAELRERSQGDLHDMMDVCFICNANRDEIEKQGEKFEDHITKVHHIWTYVDYMIGLKYVDPQETNAINSFVIQKIEEKKISWFPSFNSNEPTNEENEE